MNNIEDGVENLNNIDEYKEFPEGLIHQNTAIVKYYKERQINGGS